MRPPATATGVLLIAMLCCPVPAQVSRQQQEEWTWKDSSGKVRSRADQDRILALHKLWLESEGKSGTHADLAGADLTDADLKGAELRRAYLRGVVLTGAKLNGADLDSADLMDAVLTGAQLSREGLQGVGTNLTDAVLRGADLRAADLHATQLNGTDLLDAHLEGVVFEPKNLPPPEGIALAQGLELMTYGEEPGPLTQLRRQFQDAGYRKQEREITCALNRKEASRDSFIERWFKRIAFDWTCRYGLSPGRPLLIVLGLWALCSASYVLFMHLPGAAGIYLVGTRWFRGKTNMHCIQIRAPTIRTTQWWKVPLLRAALFFSLMAAFDIGFREINFGRWLRMLTKREYKLKAMGWARTVSGFQSLLSVYLIALWALTYFGRPFG